MARKPAARKAVKRVASKPAARKTTVKNTPIANNIPVIATIGVKRTTTRRVRRVA